MERDSTTPQVKICGLTRREDALQCVDLGVHALGFVFYPPSPRFVTETQARILCRDLPTRIWTVGVFVNESFSGIMRRAEACGLRAVQLHGQESPRLVESLHREGLRVIKTLFVNGSPSPEEASQYPAFAFLMESSGGPLPGGNAQTWDWKRAALFHESGPFLLAGGLNSENVSQAIEVAQPDAVDVSSGVESVPGKKDFDAMRRFMEAVSKSAMQNEPRRIFR